jgi:hypothetical protein
MQLRTPGEYNATLVLPRTVEQLFHTSKSGKDGIALDFVTTDGGEISTVLWLTPAAYERTVKVLTEVFKFDGDFNALAKGAGFPNLDCKLVVEMEDYQGNDGTTKSSAKVKWINSRGPQRPDADVRGVMSRLSKITGQQAPIERPSASGGYRKPSATPPPQGGDEDWSDTSIPF